MSSAPAVQLSFTIRTSPNVKTVHLLGSWDNYKSQLPLSHSKDPDAKPGSWKGTFRFQGAHTLKLGTRYWYYYIVDGYHVSHDPAKEFTTEPTTGRKLNILDVPGSKSSSGPAARSMPEPRSPTSNRHSREIPQGRALSPSKIQHPKPSKPYASRPIREAGRPADAVGELGNRLAGTKLMDLDYKHYSASVSSVSSNSTSSGDTVFSSDSERDSPGSVSSASSGCSCERYGITRSGQRVKLSCGGKRCGNVSSPDCSGSEVSDDTTSESETESELEAARRQAARGREAPRTVQEPPLSPRRVPPAADRRRR